GVQVCQARARLINREIDRPITKALQWLPQAAHTAFTRAPDLLEVDFERHEFFAAAGLMQYMSICVTDNRASTSAIGQAIDVENVALVGGCHRTGNGQLHIPIPGS